MLCEDRRRAAARFLKLTCCYHGGYLEIFPCARRAAGVWPGSHLSLFLCVDDPQHIFAGGRGTRGIVISCVGNAYSDVGQGFSAPEINLLPERLIGSPDRALTNSVQYLISVIVFPGSKSWGPACCTLRCRP